MVGALRSGTWCGCYRGPRSGSTRSTSRPDRDLTIFVINWQTRNVRKYGVSRLKHTQARSSSVPEAGRAGPSHDLAGAQHTLDFASLNANRLSRFAKSACEVAIEARNPRRPPML